MRARTIVAGMTVTLTAALAAAIPATGASAAESAPADDSGNTAVVGPLLDFFGFGSNVGAPLMCAVGDSLLTVGFTEFHVQDQGAPINDALGQGCGAFRDQGNNYVAQGKTMQAPYASAFNPYANPAIDAFADGLTKIGTDYGDQLAPFGPTVTTFGSTVRYFKGSPPESTKE